MSGKQLRKVKLKSIRDYDVCIQKAVPETQEWEESKVWAAK